MPERDWNKDLKFLERLKKVDHAFGVSISWVLDFGEYWLQRVRELEEENRKLNDIVGMVRKYKDIVNSFIYALHADWENKNEHFHIINSWLTNVEEAGIELDKALAELEGGQE